MGKGNVKRFLWQLYEKTRQENRILKMNQNTGSDGIILLDEILRMRW